ncbi:heavy metal translocating P-type ATPase [Ovoidimarina sediminis]|uniref:heavy metal translocating P-type ATPase n=1 Tax=Ovoidimarina sediminis TaxID=3079856 RepID=UPI00290685B0|nr:heavy metal translocating P-type ATPase [Rhodophyticola sp. MJ-SS7]MDU8945927.1 heavy metal translocating P-type ATPase [Rhodophyticola sp. MJ-SS7]
MTMAEAPGAAACPGCLAAPAEAVRRPAATADQTLRLSLPTIHCAGCISSVEHALAAVPGVSGARVNLTLKRAQVEAGAGVTAEALIDTLKAAGFEAHELDAEALTASETDPQGRDLLMRLAVAFFANMNVMLLSVAIWSGAEDATRDLFHWISGAIAIPTVIFSGRPFYVSAWSALSARRLNMDVPISLAIILAVGLSLWETALSGHHAYFDAALSLVFFLLLGRYLDHRTRASARSAASELAALDVPTAIRLRNGAEETVRAAALAIGDTVRVRPGGRIPADGTLAKGETEIDRSVMTGETLPARAAPGDAVHAGEVNLTGPIELTVMAAGHDTALARIADLVAAAEAGRANYTGLADRAARAYAPVVHLMALGAFLVWMWISGGDTRLALNIAVATLIITCPCAMGLAVPAVTAVASGRLFKRGTLIKSGTALERLAEVDTVVFDKTGTLTLGTPAATGLDAHDGETLGLALALAAGSDHPLARALTAGIAAQGIRAARVTELREIPGQGIEGRIGDTPLRLGRAAWVGATPLAETGTYLKVGDGMPVAFAFRDAPRPGAVEAVEGLLSRGLRVILLSGDAETPVAGFAARLGLPEHHAGMSPEDKAAFLAGLAGEGRTVLMVGDGLNDTAALAAAHVSASPASALEAARAASDIVLTGESLADLPRILDVAISARRRIRENFAISTVYNVIAVPIALVGLATPLAAALAMSASSLSVSLNAMRVKR